MKPWPIARSILIACAIAIGLLEGCPIPEREQEQHLPDAVVSAIHAGDKVRKQILGLDLLGFRPFQLVIDLTDVHQRWKLFAGANKLRYRMEISARDADGWHLLYRPLDDDHAYLGDQLAYRRMRGSWAPRGLQGPRGAYPHFATWIARQIFASDPRWVEVRIEMEEVKIGPSGGYTPTGKLDYPLSRTREEVAP